MSVSEERIVLYDDTADSPNGNGTTVAAILDCSPDGAAKLIIDDHYCSGHNNPYWDSDDMTHQLSLPAKSTVALANALGTDLDGLLAAVSSRFGGDGKNAVQGLMRFCDAHMITWESATGNARDELGNTMATQTSAKTDTSDEIDEDDWLLLGDTTRLKRAVRRDKPMVPDASVAARAMSYGWVPDYHLSGEFSFNHDVTLGTVMVMAYDHVLGTSTKVRFAPSGRREDWMSASTALERCAGRRGLEELRNAVSDAEALDWKLAHVCGCAWTEMSLSKQFREDSKDPSADESQFTQDGPARDALLAALHERTSCEDDGLIQAARLVAHIAHKGQTDQAGNAYVDHPRRVARNVKESGGTTDAVAAGWLHDVVEDTPVTLDFLADAGFPVTVIQAVDAVTKRSGEPTEAYVRRIAANPLGVMVKHADLADNTDPDRLALLEPATRDRLEAKYDKFGADLDAAVLS